MRKFDTKVQYLKYLALREVARHEWEGDLKEKLLDIPKEIVPDGEKPSIRCCIYKERAVFGERLKMAMGGDVGNPHAVEVIKIACDECPAEGYLVGDACRGCVAHRCAEVCKFGAITYDEHQKAHIDKSKCKNCGACSKVCPYNAIQNHVRPCVAACKAKAIAMDEQMRAEINYDKCISCGACVYMCPFGAFTDKSYMLDIVNILKNKGDSRVYAVVAPSISGQFSYAKLGQVVSAMKMLGFHTVIEAALGGDMVAIKEAQELAEKGNLMNSCCPGFVQFVKNEFPDLAKNISHNFSPMAEMAKYLKEHDPECKVIFVGPCTAKKAEVQREEVRQYVDGVMTFEELQALIDSRDIDIMSLEEDVLDNASYYGRIFARSGGLTEAVAESLKEQGIDFEVRATVCDGLEECRMALLKASKGVDVGNFIEGMACSGGCIGGAGCLTHGPKNKAEVDKYGNMAAEKKILDAVKVLEN